MLNRIRVRGKLLLLLATPLVALVVFAYLGVADRLDAATSQTREDHLAQLADSGSDLSRAVADERLVEMMVDAGAETDLNGWATLTQNAIIGWLNSAAAARSHIDASQTVSEVDQLTIRLNDRIAEGNQSERSATTRLAELSQLSRSIDGVNRALAAEASDLDLYRALFVQGYATEMQDAATTIAIVGANSIRSGEITTVAVDQIDTASSQFVEAATEFQNQASAQIVALLADLRNNELLPRVAGGLDQTGRELQSLVSRGDAKSQIEWLDTGLRRIDGIHGLSEQLLQDASAAAAARAQFARDGASNFMILAGSVIAAALLMAVLIGRSISHPLVRLSRSAKQLSSEELPALVESMRTGGGGDRPVMTPIVSRGRDEVAQLGQAISEIQRVTVEVADEQTALLHRGISEMFVNLARRNQSLLERQIQFIDGLELAEEDPDQLENLFRLDHLATRMRRNAESLLVLAGGEPSRRRGEPVGITSIIRVAISEIENYSRVDLRSIDDSLVSSAVAVDLAHLISELMENATQFSPPDSRVDVVGHRTLERTYQITIVDHGIGMTEEQLAESNRTLAEPPVIGLDMGRSLGFTVASILAHRLGLTVRLTATPLGGLTAVVALSATLLRDQESTEWTLQPTVRHDRETSPLPTRDRGASADQLTQDLDLFEIFGSSHETSTATVQASHTSKLPPPPTRPTGDPESALPRRTPRVRPDTPASPESGIGHTDRPIGSSARSPEQVREMLTQYRGGLQRGRHPSDEMPTHRSN